MSHKETYYVTRKQSEFIELVKNKTFVATALVDREQEYDDLFSDEWLFDEKFERDLLSYLGGDENVKFVTNDDEKYLLTRVDEDGDIVYFKFNNSATPSWTLDKKSAYVDSHEEILQWLTPAWELDKL